MDPRSQEEVGARTDEIILPPPPELRAAADALEGAIGSYVSAFATLGPGGTREALDEAGLMLLLMIRHIEGVILLARQDLVLLPGAMVMARTAFETGVAIRWMLDPDDPYEREMRWLRMCWAHEDYHRRTADRIESLKGDPSRFRKTAERLSQFHSKVAATLPEPHLSRYRHGKPPSLKDMLDALGQEGQYLLYILTSQFVHSTQFATGIYRQHLGSMKEFGEFVTLYDWQVCLRLCWNSLGQTGSRFLKRAGGDPQAFASPEVVRAVVTALEAMSERGQ